MEVKLIVVNCSAAYSSWWYRSVLQLQLAELATRVQIVSKEGQVCLRKQHLIEGGDWASREHGWNQKLVWKKMEEKTKGKV